MHSHHLGCHPICVAGVGIEPFNTTSGLWARRATNCSTPQFSPAKITTNKINSKGNKKKCEFVQDKTFSIIPSGKFAGGARIPLQSIPGKLCGTE